MWQPPARYDARWKLATRSYQLNQEFERVYAEVEVKQRDTYSTFVSAAQRKFAEVRLPSEIIPVVYRAAAVTIRG
jgi:hypothetical protein